MRALPNSLRLNHKNCYSVFNYSPGGFTMQRIVHFPSVTSVALFVLIIISSTFAVAQKADSPSLTSDIVPAGLSITPLDDKTALIRAQLPQEKPGGEVARSEEHTSELQSRENLVCRLLLEKKKK